MVLKKVWLMWCDHWSKSPRNGTRLIRHCSCHTNGGHKVPSSFHPVDVWVGSNVCVVVPHSASHLSKDSYRSNLWQYKQTFVLHVLESMSCPQAFCSLWCRQLQQYRHSILQKPCCTKPKMQTCHFCTLSTVPFMYYTPCAEHTQQMSGDFWPCSTVEGPLKSMK